MGRLTFSENEQILCYHGPLIYQAKVLKAEDWVGTEAEGGETGPHYFVHYKGWKQRWDEWVPEVRALKVNEENEALQKQLLDQMNAKAAAAAAAAAEAAAAASSTNPTGSGAPNGHASLSPLAGRKFGPRGKRGQDGVGHDREEEWSKRPEVRFPIPDPLKAQLVDDWEWVTKNKQLVPLPREPSVSQVLEQWREERLKALIKVDHLSGPELERQEDLIKEIADGLRLYFDKSLGANLLYRFERPQYLDFRNGQYNDRTKTSDPEPSDIYGPEHLLRLFVNLPEMIAHTTLDKPMVDLLREHVNELMRWLNKRKDLFLREYEDASPSYMALVKV